MVRFHNSAWGKARPLLGVSAMPLGIEYRFASNQIGEHQWTTPRDRARPGLRRGPPARCRSGCLRAPRRHTTFPRGLRQRRRLESTNPPGAVSPRHPSERPPTTRRAHARRAIELRLAGLASRPQRSALTPGQHPASREQMMSRVFSIKWAVVPVRSLVKEL
jgi:hypothetical protein